MLPICLVSTVNPFLHSLGNLAFIAMELKHYCPVESKIESIIESKVQSIVQSIVQSRVQSIVQSRVQVLYLPKICCRLNLVSCPDPLHTCEKEGLVF